MRLSFQPLLLQTTRNILLSFLYHIYFVLPFSYPCFPFSLWLHGRVYRALIYCQPPTCPQSICAGHQANEHMCCGVECYKNNQWNVTHLVTFLAQTLTAYMKGRHSLFLLSYYRTQGASFVSALQGSVHKHNHWLSDRSSVISSDWSERSSSLGTLRSQKFHLTCISILKQKSVIASQ